MGAEISKWIAFVLGAMILQTTIVPMIGVLGVRPDLVILALFFLSVRFGMLTGIWAGFAIGLMQDVYAPSQMLGQASLAGTIIGGFFGFFNDRTMRIDAPMKALIILSGILAHDIIFHGVQLMRLGQNLSSLPITLITRSLPSAIYSVALSAAIYFYVNAIRPNLRR